MHQRSDEQVEEGRSMMITGKSRRMLRPFVDPKLVKRGDATRITAGVFGEFSGSERTEQSRDIT